MFERRLVDSSTPGIPRVHIPYFYVSQKAQTICLKASAYRRCFSNRNSSGTRAQWNRDLHPAPDLGLGPSQVPEHGYG